ERERSGGKDGKVTSLRMSYAGGGEPLVLLLEESGIVTRCEITTYEPDTLMDLSFDDDARVLKLIMKVSTPLFLLRYLAHSAPHHQSEWLRDAFNEIDPSSEKITITFSPAEHAPTPYNRYANAKRKGEDDEEGSRPTFRLESHGTLGSSEFLTPSELLVHLLEWFLPISACFWYVFDRLLVFSASDLHSSRTLELLAVLSKATSLPSILVPRSATSPAGTSIPLGAAGAYTIVAQSGISTVPSSYITGDIGISPAAMTFITGFSFSSADASTPSKSSQIFGSAWAPETTGSSSPQAASDMIAAYNNGAAQGPATATELNGGALDNLNLTKGMRTLTLNGACGDVFVFQAAYLGLSQLSVLPAEVFPRSGAISTGANSNITLTGGLQSNSIYWIGATSLTTQVFASSDLRSKELLCFLTLEFSVLSGVSSNFAGIILTATNVVIAGTLDGAIYTQTEVALHQATITRPAGCIACTDALAATCDSRGASLTW
ncbi:cell cycle checkpoint protein, partial [Phenoliferia sp. Uapishka_3]